MKKLSLLLSLVIVFGIFVGTFTTISAADDGYYHGEKTDVEFWHYTDDGGNYTSYRLPSVTVTKKDTIIICGEARTGIAQDGYKDSNADLGQHDIYIRRSTDGGKSFSNPIWIAEGLTYHQAVGGETLNNPVIFVDNNNKLHMLFACNMGINGVYYTHSKDDGATWSVPVNIKEMIGGGKRWQTIAFGPGHGITLENGRLIIAAWIDDASVYPVYSDDNGSSWRLGGKVAGNKDESTIVALSDGSVMVNSRQYTYADENLPYRHVSVSKTGTSDWSLTQQDKTLIDPACAAGMCSVNIAGLPYSILFVNCASTTERKNITVRCSFNDGITWEKSLVINSNNGGYSDIAVDSKGKAYVIYETRENHINGRTVRLATFSFYDEFCKSDATLSATQTEFYSLANIIKETNGIEKSVTTNGELQLRVNDPSEAYTVFDLTMTTKTLNISKKTSLVIKIKNESATSTVGIYTQSGRTKSYDKSNYKELYVPNDGNYHNILLDYSELGLGGNLYSLKLVLGNTDYPCTVGDTIVISMIEFLNSKEQAQEKYELTEFKPSGDVSDTQQAVIENEEKQGCGSSVNALYVVPLTFAAVLAVCRKKGKKYE